MLDVIRTLEKYMNENTACVVVTVTGVSGSTPAKTGFKMLVDSNGLVTGTVGGGGLEHYALKKCSELLQSGEKYYTGVFNLTGSPNSGPGETKTEGDKNIKIDALCGGEVTLFFEVYYRTKAIHIFGAGHVAKALINFAAELKYFVHVYDNRDEQLDQIPNSGLIKKHKTDLTSLNKNNVNISGSDFIVIVTHNHTNDLNVLEFLYGNYGSIRYIGMIGSVKKVKESTAIIKNKFKGDIKFDNLYAPIGLDIGGETPAEIALSIMVEIQSINSDKENNHLRIKY